MKIMIGGGFDDSERDSPQSTNIRLLAQKLGDQVIRQNHGLRSGNMTSLDAIVIEAACNAVPEGKNCEDLVVSYTPRGAEKFTGMGAVHNSGIDDWSVLSGRKLRVPEPLEDADVLILLGGFDSTYTAANWACTSAKPILPVASFGLAAERDTPIHFDIQGYSWIDWAGGKHLREQLKPRIAKLAQDFGAQPV